METLRRIAEADGSVVTATPNRVVDVTDPASEAEGVAWWEELTGLGGEGMVVKPLDLRREGFAWADPAGAEVPRAGVPPDHLRAGVHAPLKPRASPEARALGEMLPGAPGVCPRIEGLERFVRREPLRRVHECAFAILGLESEPVDPRL